MAGRRPKARYCCDRCRVAAYRARVGRPECPTTPDRVIVRAGASETVSVAALQIAAVTGGRSAEGGGDVGLLMSFAGALR
jgi:hypothetical protein